jgi:Restriction endonuclease
VKQSAIGSRHLLLHLPDDWTNDQKGDFFECFVADLLKPMRYEVRQRLRVTGMEIDLLAKGLDQPRTILVECTAQRDALPADTISKLLGNVTLRGADAGWLFSTSDLSKDGRGQWEEIERNPELARRFTWYPPERLIDILIDQSAVVDPSAPIANWGLLARGDATLVCSPGGRNWLIEIIEDGLPAYFTVLAGTTGNLVPE